MPVPENSILSKIPPADFALANELDQVCAFCALTNLQEGRRLMASVIEKGINEGPRIDSRTKALTIMRAFCQDGCEPPGNTVKARLSCFFRINHR